MRVGVITGVLLLASATAMAQVADRSASDHPLGGITPSPPLDIGPWPPRGLPREFHAPPAAPVVYRIADAKLQDVAKPDLGLGRACRTGALFLPRARPRAHIGTDVYEAALGKQLIGQKQWREQLDPERVYVFRDADSTACTVWVVRGRAAAAPARRP